MSSNPLKESVYNSHQSRLVTNILKKLLLLSCSSLMTSEDFKEGFSLGNLTMQLELGHENLSPFILILSFAF